MAKKKLHKRTDPPIHGLFIMGEVECWHVNMVAHHTEIEVPRERAQTEERQRDGTVVYKHRAVSDHLTLDLDVVLREPIRGFDRLAFSITEWSAEEYGGIAGELHYDKESGMRGGAHMSGSFVRDLYAFLLSGEKSVFEIATKNGFSRRSARVTSLAFSDARHPQWTEGDCGLI
ncbi:MAG TPA: hypothetical protein PLU44_17020 [Candidatus Krumholzibacteria bacterium]|nr:hypothetical protein [Candidatus Krumholzibacteria bacterium]HRY42053.1 hypothetical protein [Candidatus Krumholzibacteria bacterium]